MSTKDHIILIRQTYCIINSIYKATFHIRSHTFFTSLSLFRTHFLAGFRHPWPCKPLISRKLGAGGNYPKTAISLCARLEELMSSLFREVSVHLTRSICETVNKLPAWEPVPFREIQPENWSSENRCHKQRGKKEGQTLFHNIGRTSCWYIYRYWR